LTGVAAEAWKDSSVAIGSETRSSDHPCTPPTVHGAVVLTRTGRGLALLIGEWDAPGDAATRWAALEHLHGLAAAAFDAQAARDDLARRARHAAALAEFARAGTSPLNLAEILDHAARLAVQATGARGGALWIALASGTVDLRATHGPLGTRERLGRGLGALAAAAIERAQPVVLDRVVDEPGLSPDVAAQLQSIAVFPLMAYGRGAGALAVYDRGTSHPAESESFDRADLEFLATLADMVALADDQARRCEGLRLAEHRQRELQQQVALTERLAALGEMAARVAHEVRNPLASIGAFARRVHRNLGPDDPSREYLEIVIREAERLERMVGEQLQYATLQRPRLQIESLNGVVQEALQAAGERLVRRRVRLLKKLSPDLPPLLLDAERIRRVMGNILDNALESVSPGGRVRVESRRSGSYVVLEVANDGPRRPGDLMEQLFVPFALSRQGGPGVGLAVAQQILKQHGGEMRVRSEGEWSTVFSFTLPIPENQDRRRPGLNRRDARADRRERFPDR
jgi:signal transduction histidine kinase